MRIKRRRQWQRKAENCLRLKLTLFAGAFCCAYIRSPPAKRNCKIKGEKSFDFWLTARLASVLRSLEAHRSDTLVTLLLSSVRRPLPCRMLFLRGLRGVMLLTFNTCFLSCLVFSLFLFMLGILNTLSCADLRRLVCMRVTKELWLHDIKFGLINAVGAAGWTWNRALNAVIWAMRGWSLWRFCLGWRGALVECAFVYWVGNDGVIRCGITMRKRLGSNEADKLSLRMLIHAFQV